jgi:hypothetical protein
MEGELNTLVKGAAYYYDQLRERGIPEALATRIVGDWYNGCVTVAVNYFEGRIQRGVRAITRRMASTMNMGALDEN